MFDTEFFFLVLLPPVIFEAGYTLNPGTLFKNFDAVAVFAFLGGAGAVGLPALDLG